MFSSNGLGNRSCFADIFNHRAISCLSSFKTLPLLSTSQFLPSLCRETTIKMTILPIFLIVGVILTSTTAADPATGSTVLDSLKDGFDVFYKYSSHATVSFTGHVDQVSETSDIYLRKTKKYFDVPRFVMRLENPTVEADPAKPLTPEELTALALPLVVPIADQECFIDDFMGSRRDIQRSLVWKDSVLRLLERNLTDATFDSDEKEVVDEDHLFGKCRVKMTVDKKDELSIAIELFVKKGDCEGSYSQQFVNFLRKYENNHVTGVTDETSFKFTRYLSKATHQFVKSELKIQGAFIAEEASAKHEIPFEVSKQIEFQSYKPIEEDINERKANQYYRKTKF